MKSSMMQCLAMAAVLSGTARAASFDVGTGEVKTLDDAAIGQYGAISVAPGGVLVLDTSEAPSVAITGSGVIRKSNSASWTMNAENTVFAGTWEIIGGVVECSTDMNPFGRNIAGSGGCVIAVTNGATLAVSGDGVSAAGFDNKMVVIGGDGVDGRGALEFASSIVDTSGRLLRYLTVAEDATLSMKGLAILVAGSIDLDGHSLTMSGGGALHVMDMEISETGEIVVVGTAQKVTQLMFRSWSNSSIAGKLTDTDGMCFTLGGYAAIGTYNRYRTFSRPLHVRGRNNVLKHIEQHPNDLVEDRSCEHQVWAGPITFLDGDDQSILNVNVDHQYCGLTLSGKISGPGGIKFTGSGCTYIANGENDYTGATTFSPVTWPSAYVIGSSGAIPEYSKNQADLVWTKGLLVLSGTDPYRFWRLNVQNSVRANFTTCVMLDGADVTLTKDGYWGVGVGGHIGRLVVTNSLVRSEDLSQADSFNPAYEAYASMTNSLVVGCGASGILEVEAGSVISNRLQVGMHDGAGAIWTLRSYGAVRQRGGSVVAVSPKDGKYLKGNALAVGQSCGGYYELSGGELVSHGTFSVGVGGIGTMWIRDGAFIVTNFLNTTTQGELAIGAFNGGLGAIRVSGGALRHYGKKEIFVGNGNNKNAFNSLTVDGTGAFCDFGDAQFNHGYGNTESTFTVNMNGGTLKTGMLYKHKNQNHHLGNRLLINFNGGTFMCATGAGVFGPSENGADRITVYSGGATIDTDGHDAWVSQPIEAPSGKGIASIGLGGPIAYTNAMSPIVKIMSDTGCGASAFAHYDWESHAVDRIDVLSSGVGYEDAKVVLAFDPGVSMEIATENVTFADNAIGGSLTKKGDGKLFLAAANKWAGATCVRGGALVAKCDWAIPADTAVVLSDGATLDLENRVHRISSVTYQVGGGSIVQSENAEMPEAVTFELSVDEILAGKTIPFTGDFDLSKVTLSVKGAFPDDMDGATRYPFVTTAGQFNGKPSVSAPTLPTGYRFAFGPKRISLIPMKGFSVICR